MKRKNYVTPRTTPVVTTLYKNFMQQFDTAGDASGDPINARTKERNDWEENHQEEITTEMSLW